MKKAGWGLAVLFALTTMGTGIAAAKDQTFSGEIMDSSCADMGSHAMMLKGHGMAGKENDPAAKKMCTLDCVKAGAKFVLFNAQSKTMYQLDDQTKPVDFAGKNVKVLGTLDKATKTIHVTTIKATS
jgi:hypothetical protein